MRRVLLLVLFLVPASGYSQSGTLGEAVDKYNAKLAFGSGYLSGKIETDDQRSRHRSGYRFAFDASGENFYIASSFDGNASTLLIQKNGTFDALLGRDFSSDRWDALVRSSLGALSRFLRNPLGKVEALETISEERNLGPFLCDTFVVPTDKGSKTYWFSQDGLLRKIEEGDTDRVVGQTLIPSYVVGPRFAFPTLIATVGYYGSVTKHHLSDIRLIDAAQYEASKASLVEEFTAAPVLPPAPSSGILAP